MAVVLHRVRQQTALVKPFHRVALEAGGCPRVGQIRQHRGAAGIKFHVDRHIEFHRADFFQFPEGVQHEVRQGIRAQLEHPVGGNQAQQSDGRTIFGENKKIQFAIRPQFPRAEQGGVGQDGASHLGRFDEQNPAGLCDGAGMARFEETADFFVKGQQEAYRGAERLIQRPHQVRCHCAKSFVSIARFGRTNGDLWAFSGVRSISIASGP